MIDSVQLTAVAVREAIYALLRRRAECNIQLELFQRFPADLSQEIDSQISEITLISAVIEEFTRYEAVQAIQAMNHCSAIPALHQSL